MLSAITLSKTILLLEKHLLFLSMKGLRCLYINLLNIQLILKQTITILDDNYLDQFCHLFYVPEFL